MHCLATCSIKQKPLGIPKASRGPRQRRDVYARFYWDVGSNGWFPHQFETRLSHLATFASNSHFGTMDEIRSATSEFLTQTQGQLTPQEKADLKLLAKKEGTSTYYLYLRELIYKNNLYLAVPPALAQYLEYIHTAQTMGMDKVTHEAKELAFQIKLHLAHESQEKTSSRSSTISIFFSVSRTCRPQNMRFETLLLASISLLP